MGNAVTSPGTSEASERRSLRLRLRRPILILGAAALFLAGAAIWGRGALAWWTRQMASSRLSLGAFSAAEQ